MGTDYDDGTGTLDFRLLKDKIEQLEVSAGGPASGVSFDPSETNLESVTVQTAIAELDSDLNAITIPEPQTAAEVPYTPGNLESTNVQAAIEELDTKVENLEIPNPSAASEVTFDDQNTDITADNVQTALEALDTLIGDFEQQITIGTQYRIPIVNSGADDFTYSDALQFDGDNLTTKPPIIADLAAPSSETYMLTIDDTGEVSSDEIPSGGGTEITIGTDNQIPVVNTDGTDFEYSANLVFDGTKLDVTGGLDVSSNTDIDGTLNVQGEVTLQDIVAPSSETHMVTVSDTGVLSHTEIPSGGGGGSSIELVDFTPTYGGFFGTSTFTSNVGTYWLEPIVRPVGDFESFDFYRLNLRVHTVIDTPDTIEESELSLVYPTISGYSLVESYFNFYPVSTGIYYSTDENIDGSIHLVGVADSSSIVFYSFGYPESDDHILFGFSNVANLVAASGDEFVFAGSVIIKATIDV